MCWSFDVNQDSSNLARQPERIFQYFAVSLCLCPLGLIASSNTLPHDHESQSSFVRSRTVHAHWNAPRADDGDFLAKRANALSAAHFNARRATATHNISPNTATTLCDFDKRTESELWEDLGGDMASYPSHVLLDGYRQDLFYMWEERTG